MPSHYGRLSQMATDWPMPSGSSGESFVNPLARVAQVAPEQRPSRRRAPKRSRDDKIKDAAFRILSKRVKYGPSNANAPGMIPYAIVPREMDSLVDHEGRAPVGIDINEMDKHERFVMSHWLAAAERNKAAFSGGSAR